MVVVSVMEMVLVVEIVGVEDGGTVVESEGKGEGIVDWVGV